jgi:hypothetical protein
MSAIGPQRLNGAAASSVTRGEADRPLTGNSGCAVQHRPTSLKRTKLVLVGALA